MEEEFLDLEDEYPLEDVLVVENKNAAPEEALLPPRNWKPPSWYKDYEVKYKVNFSEFEKKVTVTLRDALTGPDVEK